MKNFSKCLLVFAVMVFTSFAFAQSTITGKVLDSDTNLPLPGANVIEKGTTNGTTTDFDGNFTLTTNMDSGEIVITYVGYSPLNVSFSGNQTLGDLMISPDNSLEEIVVIGRGVIDLEEDRQTPIAVSTVTSAEIQQKSVGNVEFPEVMRNVPSVYASNDTGFGDSQMFLRGFDQTNTAFLLNGQPINGMEDGRMYWSNWSGMTDIANAVQVQRGLGSSKLAISSVGGTVNIVSKTTDKTEGGFVRFLGGNDSFIKTTASYNTGLNEDGWGFSFLLDHWQAHRKFAQGTAGQGQNYFFSVGKLAGDHNFNFLVFGAPQWHMQKWSQSIETLEKFRKYNQHWGRDEGEIESERTNFYHKPVFNLNWDWNISDVSNLSTVLYASFGRGGGTGPRGNSPIREDDYNIDGLILDGQIDFAATRARNQDIGIGGDYGGPLGAGYIRRASMNNHRWYGMVTNFETELSTNWNFNVGGDVRFYTGDHFRQVVDFYDLEGWSNDRPDDRIVRESFSFNPWKTLTNFADENERINYDYSEDINYYGLFSQIEYASDAFSAFFQGAISTQSYQRQDRFDRDANGTPAESPKVNKGGYNLKSGAAYKLNDEHQVFANVGYYSRQPFLDNIFAGNTELAEPEVDNEEITGIEAGYTFENQKWRLNANLYRTQWANRYIANGNNIIEIATSEEIDLSREQTDVTQLHQGIEIDGQYKLSNTFRAGAYASIGKWEFEGSTPFRSRDFRDGTYFTNADISDYTDRDGNPLPANFFEGEVDLDGVEIGNAPQLSYGLNFLWQAFDDFEFGVDFNHYGRMNEFVDVSDVVAEGSNYENIELDGYSRFDLTARYNFSLGNQPFVLRANVYNLFDNDYIAQSDAFGYFYGLGTTWNASLTYRF